MGPAFGFGVAAPSQTDFLATIATLRHPTEVNRVAACPDRPQLLASKAASGAVLLFDYEREPNRESYHDADLVLPNAEHAEGFALAWSPTVKHSIVSGGNDGRRSMESTQNLAKQFAHLVYCFAFCDPCFAYQSIRRR